MDRRTETRLTAIHLNALEHMADRAEDWQRIIGAFARVTGDDPEKQKRAYIYLDILEEVLKDERNISKTGEADHGRSQGRETKTA